MKDWKRKYTSMMLLASMLILCVSCGSDAGEPSGGETAAGDETTTSEETTGRYDPGLPDADFGGYEFTFAVRGEEGVQYHWNGTDIVADEQNGDILNDAVYERNNYLRDKYNVKIAAKFCGGTSTSTSGSEMSKVISSSIMSGDADFDAILTSPYDSVGYVMNEYVTDLSKINNMDLTREWWDQNVTRDLSFGSKVYMASGDISYIDNKATHVMVFDKQLVDEYDIDDPYEDVRSGKWTLDKFFANCDKVTADLNGDNVFSKEDRFGYAYWQDAAFAFIYSTGNSFGEIRNGEPELTLYSERMVDSWQKLISFIKTDSAFSILDNLKQFEDNNADSALDYMLSGHHALYGFTSVSVVLQLRSSDADFGIIPHPKFDEAQKNYIVSPHSYGNTLLTVPVTTRDPDRTGFILEAFSAKSAEIVTPAFYDKTLIGKSTRDDESAEMLELIFSSKKYDIGNFFAWGDLTNKVMTAWNKKNENIASVYQGAEAKALADIDKIKELFE